MKSISIQVDDDTPSNSKSVVNENFFENVSSQMIFPIEDDDQSLNILPEINLRNEIPMKI